jgi:hypothetical protein
LQEATVAMLASGGKIEPAQLDIMSYKLVSILIGTMRSVFENGLDEKSMFATRNLLVSAYIRYMDTAAETVSLDDACNLQDLRR